MADRVSYRNLLVGAYEYFQQEMLHKLVANQPKTHLQTITNQMKTKTINYGDIRLNNIRKYLDLFPGFTRQVYVVIIITFLISLTMASCQKELSFLVSQYTSWADLGIKILNFGLFLNIKHFVAKQER